ncbi:protein FRIGIDA [Benincasa hispida]|uniref:protein FRIGIDA n=1 Tax=Benincasa hispida TaxID=102211 RepID=UPI0019027141|nr:protein FRIGIDA [Benincasa hispida]
MSLMANLPLASAVDSFVEAVKEEESKTDARLGEGPCQSKPDPQEPPFQFLKYSYVDELGSLSTAIRAFHCRFNELQDHLGFIHNAIDARFKQHMFDSSIIVATAESGRNPVSSSSPRSNLPETRSDFGKIDGREGVDKQPESSSLSELQHLCETMCSRGLRKYIVSHLSDLARLRHEIPLALQCAPNPAKLVFDCIGRFYLQGSKAYTKDSPMIPARQASILILELFLISSAAETKTDKRTEIEPSLKVEADLAAIAWRKRLVTESGSCQASDIDARGLLLFLASFGIPTVFTNDDLRDLLRSSNSKGISNALRRSHFLISRIPDIIKGMMNSSKNVEAVDIIYAFGMEDVFPPQEILLSFLQECDETWKKRINEVRGSTMQLKRVSEEKLASLKCVLKCLEDHKLDPVKSLPGWKIHEMIKNLEKDIVELGKRMEDNASMKRKIDEASTQKYLSQEIKRLRRVAASKGGFPDMSYPVNGLLEQNAATFLEDKSCFSSGSSSIPQKILEGGRSARLGNYQTALSLRGPGLVETTVLPADIGSSISSAAASFPRGIAKGRDSIEASIYNKMGPTRELAAYKDISVGQSFIQQAMPTLKTTPTPPPPTVESYSAVDGFMGHTTSNHFDLYHFADSAVFDNDAPKSSSTQTGNLSRLRLPHHHHPPYFYN